MTKMLRLIKNEMVKLARRKSIWIMLVVTLAIAVGTAVLYNYSKVSDEPSGEEYLVSQWKEEITKLERFFAADHYYSDRYADESLRGKQYRNRSAMLQYLVDNQYSPYDWRYTSGIIEQLFYHKLQKDVNPGYDMSEHDRLQTLIDIDNWQQYYLEQVDAFLAENLKMYPMAQEQVRDAAVRVYSAIGCQGLSRVDFFVTYEDNRVVFNEINTIPGFTSISMYPKLFAASGIPSEELIAELLRLALEAAK